MEQVLQPEVIWETVKARVIPGILKAMRRYVRSRIPCSMTDCARVADRMPSRWTICSAQDESHHRHDRERTEEPSGEPRRYRCCDHSGWTVMCAELSQKVIKPDGNATDGSKRSALEV